MDVTDQTFQKAVIERSAALPVVVDFWAEWCGPCRTLGPVLEREIAARNGEVELVKIDVDVNPALASEYGIRGIPAVKAFRAGRVVDEFVGARSPSAVSVFLDGLTKPSDGEELLVRLRESGEDPEMVAALDEGDEELALELLLAEIADAEPERRDSLRRLALAVFEQLGHEHSLTQAYRRRLATLLF